MPFQRHIKPILWGLLLGLSLALRIPGLFESLWFDEVWRTFVVLREEGIKDLLFHDVHNPLYNALMYGWIRLFGDSEPSIRIPSLLAGYALTWLIYRWTRPRLGERAAAIAAAWLLLSPVPVWYSTEAKNSIFTVLTAAWVLTTHTDLLTATRDKLRSRVALCTAAAVLAILTDFQAFLIIIPVWAGIAIEAFSRRMRAPRPPEGSSPQDPELLRPLATIIAATLALLSPFLIYKSLHVSDLPRDYLDLFHLKALLWFLCLWMPIGTVLPNARPNWWPLEVASTGIILLPLLCLGLRRLWQTAAGRLVCLSFFFPLCFFLIASALLHALGDKTRIYQDRNIIVLMAWYPVVFAAGIDSIKRRLLRDVAWGVVLAGALIASILIDTVLDDRWTVMAPNPDWRTAARIIDDAPGRALVISRTDLLALRYYSHDSELAEFDEGHSPAGEIARILSAHPQADEFFLLTNPWWSRLKPEEMPAIDAAYPLVERIQLRALTVERRRRGP
jgi:hypothetical protein